MSTFHAHALALHRRLPPELWTDLEAQGIPAAAIHSRLIGWDSERITIPVVGRDRKIVAFEYASFDERGRLCVLPQADDRPHLYGEPILNLSSQEIVLTEGVVESLVLSGNGFNALSATGE